MSSNTKAQLGYLMTEALHDQVMRGIDSLRLIEGLVCDSRTGSIDANDLGGYLQLLLEQTYKPLKTLEYKRWSPADDPQPAVEEKPASTGDDEAHLLRHYRALPDDDRQHVRRCAEALAYAQQEARP